MLDLCNLRERSTHLLTSGFAVLDDSTSRNDCLRHLLWIRSCENKNPVRGRLFQNLEKCIEGFGCQHVDFIDDDDTHGPIPRSKSDTPCKFPNPLNPPFPATIHFT